MSSYRVDKEYIAGSREELRNTISSAMNFLNYNLWLGLPSEAYDEADKLEQEIWDAYDKPEEGFWIFGYEVFNSTLNRMYPFIAEWVAETGNGVNIDYGEEEDDEGNKYKTYSIEGVMKDELPIDPTEGRELPIDANPFPQLPGVPPPITPLPPGTPDNPYGETPPQPRQEYQDEVERAAPVEGVRGEQPIVIPTLPQPGSPDYPIQPVEPGEPEEPTEPTEPTEPEEPEEPDSEEPTEPTEPSEPTDNDIEGILREILEEIKIQGGLTRDTILESVGELSKEISESQTTLIDIQNVMERLLDYELENGMDLSEETLGSIEAIIEGAIQQSISESEQPVGWLENIIDGIDKTTSDLVDVIKDGYGATAEGLANIAKEIKDGWYAFESRIAVNVIDSMNYVGEVLDKLPTKQREETEKMFDLGDLGFEDLFCQFLNFIKSITERCVPDGAKGK